MSRRGYMVLVVTALVLAAVVLVYSQTFSIHRGANDAQRFEIGRRIGSYERKPVAQFFADNGPSFSTMTDPREPGITAYRWNSGGCLLTLDADSNGVLISTELDSDLDHCVAPFGHFNQPRQTAAVPVGEGSAPP